jgi:hypothetical protein
VFIKISCNHAGLNYVLVNDPNPHQVKKQLEQKLNMHTPKYCERMGLGTPMQAVSPMIGVK